MINCILVNMVIGMFLTTDTPYSASVEECDEGTKYKVVETNEIVDIVSYEDGIYYIKQKDK